LSRETADVLNTLQTAGRPVSAEDAAALADLLAYRAALAEQADPTRRIARLRLEAEGFDARAEPIWRESAEFHGRASYRALQGEQELADQYLRRAQAAERLAAALEAEAFAKRLEASGLMADAAARRDLAGLLQTLAA